jgi:hypothetical protein
VHKKPQRKPERDCKQAAEQREPIRSRAALRAVVVQLCRPGLADFMMIGM